MGITVQELIEKLQGYPADSVIAIDSDDNLSGDRWEETEEGMRYYGREYDPVTDEWI